MQKYVINLARTPHRWQRFVNYNAKSGYNFIRHDARDGEFEDRYRLFEDGFIKETLSYTNGALGCALSHIDLWKLAVHEKKPITIIEDDAILHKDFDRLAEQASELAPRDWDFIGWGWNFDCPAQMNMFSGTTGCQLLLSEEGIRKNWQRFQESKSVPSLYPLVYAFGTPAYSISHKGAELLLDFLLPLHNFTMKTNFFDVNNKGIDVALNSIFPQITALGCFPPIVVTQNDRDNSLTMHDTKIKDVA